MPFISMWKESVDNIILAYQLFWAIVPGTTTKWKVLRKLRDVMSVRHHYRRDGLGWSPASGDGEKVGVGGTTIQV